jgi:hypothetical protein
MSGYGALNPVCCARRPLPQCATAGTHLRLLVAPWGGDAGADPGVAVKESRKALSGKARYCGAEAGTAFAVEAMRNRLD